MMNGKGKKKIWFTIEEFKSQLVTKIIKNPEGKSYTVSVLHPNSKEVLSAKVVLVRALDIKSDPWELLAKIGEEMKASLNVETEVQNCIKIQSKSGKKGKMDISSIS